MPIIVGGSDISGAVQYATARFVSNTNGVAGECQFRYRDDSGSYAFTIGDPIVLRINGQVAWRGTVTKIKRVYALPDAATPGARFFDIEGSDLNLLFQRRYTFHKANPVKALGTQFPAGTADDIVISELVTNWLDLSSDNLDVTSYVDHVSTPEPTLPFRAWGSGDTWAAAMRNIAAIPGAIWYIDPDANLVYTDVDTPTAPFGLSDQPDGINTVGYREMEVLADGTSLANDVLAIGFGYGSQTPVYNRLEDAASIAAHGRWQTPSINTGVWKQASIDRIANSIVYGSPTNRRGHKDDRMAVMCVVRQPGLRAGMKVAFESNVFGYSDVLPIRRMEITFPEPGDPLYRLTISHEIDPEWSMFDPFQFSIPDATLPAFRLPTPPTVETPGGCDCAVTSIVDDFNREIGANFSDGGWGSTNDGWLWFKSSGGVGLSWSVTGGQGVLDLGTTSIRATQAIEPFATTSGSIVDGPPIDAVFGDYDMQFVVTFNQGPGSFAGDFIQFVLGFTNTEPGAWGRSTSGSIYYQRSVEIWWDATASASKLGVVTDTDINDPDFNNLPCTLAWSGSISLTPNVPYAVHYQKQGSSVRARIWAASDPEPSTWDVDAIMTRDLESPANQIIMLYQRKGTWSLASTVSIDYIEISYNRCDNYRFDNFNRTVSSGWGVSSSGHAWTWDGIGTAYVNDWGHLEIGTTDQFTEMTVVTGIADNEDFTFTCRFDWSTVTRSVVFVIAGLSFGWHDSTNAAHEYVFINDGNGTFVTQFVTDFIENLSSEAMLEVKRTGTTVTLTLWDESGPQPAPQITSAVVNGDTFGKELVSITSGGLGSFVEFDWINIDYPGKPCYDGGPAPGTGTSAAGAGGTVEGGTAESQSTTDYFVGNCYVVGSTTVWLNGEIQVRGASAGLGDYYESAPGAGVITFNTPLLSTDVVQVSYIGCGEART